MPFAKPFVNPSVSKVISMSRLSAAKPLASVCLAVSLLVSGMAHADDYSDVNRMLRAGQLAEANAKVDQFLATKPRDAQMRFLKGVILTEQSKPADAISTFTKLTEDFPELPEPYNNLAVLYASQSQFDKARAALEMAIRTNPSYATAHENLGDVYAKLASQAYSKALQLDNTNTGVQPKLSLIRDLFAAPGSKSTRPVAVAAAPTPTPAPTVTPAPAPVAVAKPAPAPVAPPAPVAVAPAPPAAPAATVKPAAPTAAPTPAPTPAPAPVAANSGNASQEVSAAVQSWAAAWSAKNTSEYFSAYGKDFDASGGRRTWEEERKKRILGKNKISVKLSDMAISINGNKAQAKFRQEYNADALAVSSRKTLDLVKAGDRWVIVKETAGI
jgi:tetratricopeptide (TPR) repeat protein